MSERKDGSREPIAGSRRAKQRIAGCQTIPLCTEISTNVRFPATGYRLPVFVFWASVRA